MFPEESFLAAWAGGRQAESCASESLNQTYLLRLIDIHRLAGRLQSLGGGDFLGDKFAASLRHRALDLWVRDRFDADLREEVLGALVRDGIAALPLKGAVLGPWLYGEIGLRPSLDLDILVPQEQYEAARATLLSIGYGAETRGNRPWSSLWSHEEAFSRGNDLPVELHRHVTQRGRFSIPVEGLLERSVLWNWRGLALRRLDDVDQFLTLSIHMAHHQFLVPLSHWIDLVLLMERGLDLDELAGRARAAGATGVMRLVARHLDMLFKIPALLPYAPPLSPFRENCLRAIRPALARTSTRGILFDRWNAFWLVDRPARRFFFAAGYLGRRLLDQPFERYVR